jgi:hypothetical protein
LDRLQPNQHNRRWKRFLLGNRLFQQQHGLQPKPGRLAAKPYLSLGKPSGKAP